METSSLDPVKTRTLLLLSLGCLLAIVAAGVGLLFRLSDQERLEVKALEFGTSARLGDMSVVVTSVSTALDGTGVAIEMSGVEGDSVVEGWELFGDGKVFQASGATGDGFCGADTVVDDDGVRCVLRFPAVESVFYVSYARAGEVRQWAP